MARQRGFSLVELIIAMVIMGIVAGIVSMFIVAPVRGYIATASRGEMVDTADNALRRIGRDVRKALANSVRIPGGSGVALELIPVASGGRFMTETGDVLDLSVVDTSIDTMGPGPTATAGQSVVFYNLGTGVDGSDAYQTANTTTSNRRVITNSGAALANITMTSTALLPSATVAAPFRFSIVDSPVTYYCDLVDKKQLLRISQYGFNPIQVERPTGGSSAILATGVTECLFTYNPAAVAGRAGLVTLRLTLSSQHSDAARDGSSVTLYHALHVENLP